ncbi:MAG: biopolymer transporter ExbD [Cellvibrionaceae bacterium]
MKLKRRMSRHEVKDLDITAFMNLMIVLVPVLLMSMVFAHTTVLDLKLPDMAASPDSAQDEENRKLELVINPDHMVLNYPAGTRLKRIDKEGGEYNYKLLSLTLQEVKRQLREQGTAKRDILVLSQPDTDYQTLIHVMDTVRSFQAIVAADVVDAELFPDISLGDAPIIESGGSDEMAASGGRR